MGGQLTTGASAAQRIRRRAGSRATRTRAAANRARSPPSTSPASTVGVVGQPEPPGAVARPVVEEGADPRPHGLHLPQEHRRAGGPDALHLLHERRRPAGVLPRRAGQSAQVGAVPLQDHVAMSRSWVAVRSSYRR